MSTIGLVSCSQCLRRVHRFAALKFPNRERKGKYFFYLP
jgi:hypothetical protein